MKVKLTTARVKAGEPERYGQVVDVSDEEAQSLCETGQAVPYETDKTETATKEPAETRTAKSKGKSSRRASGRKSTSKKTQSKSGGKKQ